MAQSALISPDLGLGSGDRVYLRPEVDVRDCAGDLLIRYAHWELRLPRQAITTSSALQRLAEDRGLEGNGDPSLQAIISLLAAQGCFLPSLPEVMRLRDVFPLLQPIRSGFYAAYYRHPLWSRLREGTASDGEFAAWALHNYHISRSAGIIAARIATQFQDASLRAAFRDDALEEYWHCDAFYFVKRGRLPIEPARAKAYVPLPAVRAFEDIALRGAETDWLAHLLIAYFQESSIVFGDASERFYDDVERQYDLPGFFRGWRRHIALDRDHGHAETLATLFEDDRMLSRGTVEQSMRTLQLAHHFLLTSLDQVSAAPAAFDDAIEARQPVRVASERRIDPIVPLPDEFWPFVRERLEDSAFAALAHVRDHDDIMAAGNLAAALREASADAGATDHGNPWLVALGSFLIEQTRSPKVFLAIADDLIRSWLSPPITQGALTKFTSARGPASGSSTKELSVARYQMRELAQLARHSAPLEPLVLGIPFNAAQS